MIMAKISDTSTNQGMSTSAKHYKLIRGKEEEKKVPSIIFYFTFPLRTHREF